MDHHIPIQFLYLELHRRVMRRIEKALQPFADALAAWLNELAQRYRPNWREGWEAFLLEWQAEGVLMAPESKRALEDWIESAARYVEAPLAEIPVAEPDIEFVDPYGPAGPHPVNSWLIYRLPKDSDLTEVDVIQAREIAVVTRALGGAIEQLASSLETPGLLASLNPFGPDALTQRSEHASLSLQRTQLALLFSQLGYQKIEWTTMSRGWVAGLDGLESMDAAAAPEAGLTSVFVEDAMMVMGVAGLTKLGAQLLRRGAAQLIARVPPAVKPLAEEATAILRSITLEENSKLASDLSQAATVLTEAEMRAAAGNSRVAIMHYGNALERLVAARIQGERRLRRLFKYVGGKNNPDFIGIRRYRGLEFDITTEGQVKRHFARVYGDGLNIILYERLPGFPH